MSKKKNHYHREAKKKHFLSGFDTPLPSKGNIKNTALETGKDLLVCVVGGGLIGAAIGKPSLVIGLITTGAGHYTENRLVQLLGIGMMASNGFQSSATVNGLEGLDGVKERMKAYKDSFTQKFYLDKILKKKAAATKTTNGIGELEYFNYEGSMNGNLSALNDIEHQIAESAMQYQEQMAGTEYEEVGELEDRLY